MKKIISFIVSFMIIISVLGCLFLPASAAVSAKQLGDFDGDEEITVADALAALRIAAKLVDEDSEAIAIGDVDNDQHVTVADALAILRVAAKLAKFNHIHDWCEWHILSAATCSQTGFEIRICKSNSSHIETHEIPINYEAHEWGDWQVTTPATINNDGIETRVCKLNSSHIETRSFKYPSQGLKYQSVGLDSCMVVGIGTCDDTNVVIPETYKGLKVVSIDVDAFLECSSLTSITIPSSVTSIGKWAFYGCRSLTSIEVDKDNPKYNSEGNCLIDKETKELIQGCNTSVIPDGVTSIGMNAFCGCSGLTSVTIPSSVTSIDYAAFSECSSLTSVTIPSSVTSIGEYAFAGCSGLTSVTIPSSVMSIGECAFCECSNLTSITIPSSVTYIGRGAFGGCSSLTSVTIPSSVTYIGVGAFISCSSLNNITYQGTKSQWEAAVYSSLFTNDVIIHCIDGDIKYTKDNSYL